VRIRASKPVHLRATVDENPCTVLADDQRRVTLSGINEDDSGDHDAFREPDAVPTSARVIGEIEALIATRFSKIFKSFFLFLRRFCS
jgi:hypothetical protein